MYIITQEHLIETFARSVRLNLEEEIAARKETPESLDDWAWDNLELLGEMVYEMLGEMYGDLNSLP